MGNYISCTISHNTFKNCKGTKVILPNGEIRQFDSPIKAAELMFDTPNYFLVNTKSLQIGRRFFALSADEELEICNVYAMFLMRKLNSFVTAADMWPLLVTANSTNTARVAPEAMKIEFVPAPAPDEPKMAIDFGDTEDFCVSEFKHRLSMCKSRKPVLETIPEEPAVQRRR